MQEEVKRLQFLVGLFGGIFGLIISVVNLLSNIFVDRASLIEGLFSINVSSILAASGIALISAFLRTRLMSALQVMGADLWWNAILLNYQGFYGIWLVAVSLVLLFKYDLLKRNPYIKLSLFALYIISVSTLGVMYKNTEDSPYVWPVKLIVSLGLISIMFWFIFEDRIRALVKRNEIVEKNLEKTIPLAKIGENAAGVIHSLRNVLNRIGMGLMFIESNIDVDKGIKLVRRGLEDTTGRLQDVLEITRLTPDDRFDTIQLKRFIVGFHTVFFEDILRSRGITLEIGGPERFVKANKQRLILMLENIFQNAVEAIDSYKPDRKQITVNANESGFVIVNTGGAFPLCDSCAIKQSCLSCPRFETIGWTTKARGTGNGMPQIVRTCIEFGWDLKIYSSQERGETSFFFTTKTLR